MRLDSQFIRILHEDDGHVGLPTSASGDGSVRPEKSVAALAKAIDAMALSLEEFAEAKPSEKERTFEETFAAHAAEAQVEKPSTSGPNSAQRWASMKKPLLERQASDSMKKPLLEQQDSDSQSPEAPVVRPADIPTEPEDKETGERRTLIKQRKVAVLYEVLTACVADTEEEKTGKSVLRAGYDARQRAAIRLLALWLDIEWQKVVGSQFGLGFLSLALIETQHRTEQHHLASESVWKMSSVEMTFCRPPASNDSLAGHDSVASLLLWTMVRQQLSSWWRTWPWQPRKRRKRRKQRTRAKKRNRVGRNGSAEELLAPPL